MDIATTPRPARGPRTRIPRHIGFIPDGNRRWALGQGRSRQEGYAAGITPGLRLLERCHELGIQEVSIYGFTIENTSRARVQVNAFRGACVEFAQAAIAGGAALLAIGDSRSTLFPRELAPFLATRSLGHLKVNLLVHYSFAWDVRQLSNAPPQSAGVAHHGPMDRLGSHGASRIDLVVRWGGRRRLSGFLPFQTAYADLHVVDTLWPDMHMGELDGALAWYAQQEATLGG